MTAVAHSRADLAGALAQLQAPVGLVPTMGALHDGHRALITRARDVAGSVVVSIFVNPLQFGPNEDLARYPRTLDADVAMCAAEGVDRGVGALGRGRVPRRPGSGARRSRTAGCDSRRGQPADALRRHAHRGREVAQPGPSRGGVLRREGLPATGADHAHGRRPRARRRHRGRADRARARRARPVEPQRLPVGGRPRCARWRCHARSPRDVPRRAQRRTCSPRPGPCCVRPASTPTTSTFAAPTSVTRPSTARRGYWSPPASARPV